MNEPEPNKQVLDAERNVLRVLCQGVPEGSLLDAARQLLRRYPFRDPLHQIVFEALIEIPTMAAELTREQLTARLTNKGFPDVDLAPYFQPHGLRFDQARTLMEALAKSSDKHG